MTVQEKANAALAARDAGDPRYVALVFSLGIWLNMNPSQVEANIKKLAGVQE